MLLLHNTIRHYAWGRRDGVAELVGSEPTGEPEAELWVGAHPGAPSFVVDDPRGRDLAAVIASDPVRWLGPDLARRGVTTLPFLLKVLAIGEPLSLQAHPSSQQARAGFAREEAAGIPLDAPDRTYKDAGAKPESLVALTDTWAMCGFRPAHDAAALVGRLDLVEVEPLAKRLAGAAPYRDAMAWLLGLEGDERRTVSRSVARAAAALATDATDDPFGWVARLAEHHTDDPTCIAPLLLRLVHLAPGDSVHLPAGNLHAYLTGAGIELMAASDNVLRGGLTAKHVDVAELLTVVRFEPGVPPPPTTAHPTPGLTTYDSEEVAYGLALVEPSVVGPVLIDPQGPSLLLATGGEVHVAGPDAERPLHGGAALFVPPGDGPLTVTGPGRLWWATTGTALPTSARG